MAHRTYPVTGSATVVQQAAKNVGQSVRSGLEAYDDTPLAGRTPLLLIHGIGASASTQFNWERFLDYAKKEKPLMGRYKIYLYHYDSTRSVPDISQNLQHTLRGFIGALGGRKIKILAYSEGGLLTRNAMQDPYVDQHTDEVITVATPFHGSPLANPEWLRQQIRTESCFSLVRIGQRLAYNITGRLYPTFKEDFHWDNFDGAIPAEQYAQYNPRKTKIDYALAHKDKFVTYGSYFGLNVDPSLLPEELDIKADLPKEHVIFANLFRRNMLFSLIRNNIAKLPLAIRHAAKNAVSDAGEAKTVTHEAKAVIKEASDAPDSTVKTASVLLALANTGDATADQTDAQAVVQSGAPTALQLEKPDKAEAQLSETNAVMAVGAVQHVAQQQDAKTLPVSMMMFNDGISPISSTLWLGRYMPNANGAAISVDKLWDTLRKLKGNENTRLFAGVDHRNWMDGTTRTGEAKIRDLLNPEEPPRTIFGWLVYDLMS